MTFSLGLGEIGQNVCRRGKNWSTPLEERARCGYSEQESAGLVQPLAGESRTGSNLLQGWAGHVGASIGESSEGEIGQIFSGSGQVWAGLDIHSAGEFRIGVNFFAVVGRSGWTFYGRE